MVLDYLRSIPNVSMAHEFLNPVFYYGFRPRKNSKESLLLHVRRSINCLPGEHCGCKILIGQFPLHDISLAEFDAALPEPRYLLLYRRDVFRQFVSLKIAHQTKQYLANASEKLRTTDVEVDMDELEDLYQLNATEYRSALDTTGINQRCLPFAYEDMVADPQRLFDSELFPFLDIESARVSTGLVKQSNRPIEESVRNFREIECKLSKYRNFDPVLSPV
ncbi:Stf0 sulfotransferase [Symmachiella macrocystis]|uniref:Stf0 sulfotransferase n=2 Tax=Symmachiella macrocystis TaxID=2527985 RepID=A0A5C6B6J3_9PLAN|nr:Stf0 sulfotransferase [Symmachiella macrocystis]